MDKETGWENVERFVKSVKDKIGTQTRIVMYEDNWPWMCNARWRQAVMARVLRIENPSGHTLTFLGPDNLDDWTFTIRPLTETPLRDRMLDETGP